jgi:hypothetical protein
MIPGIGWCIAWAMRPLGGRRPASIDGWRHLRFLLLHSPKWLFFYPGVVMLGLGLVGILALLPGPLRLTPTTVLDIHTLLAASFAVLIGIQLISLSVLARRYAASEGFLPPVWRYPSIIGNLTLERELHVALIILILGVSGFVWASHLVLGESKFWPNCLHRCSAGSHCFAHVNCGRNPARCECISRVGTDHSPENKVVRPSSLGQ